MTTTWQMTATHFSRPYLSEDISCDVVVIGGGITGVTASYMLAAEGKSVVLIEKDQIEGVATSRTTAFLTHVIDTDLAALAQMFDEGKAKRIWNSHKEAIDTVEDVINKESIECDFKRCSNYIFATKEDEFESLKEEAGLAKKLGFDVSIHRDDKHPFKNFGYMDVKNQAKFHPLKYLAGLAEATQKRGVRMYEKTEANDIEQLEGGIIKVTTDYGLVFAQHVVIATYDPFNHPKELFAHKGPYISYILELEVPKGLIEEAIYEDTNNPYNYFRIDPEDDYDRMILGGADHRREIPMNHEKNFQALRDYFHEILPQVEYKERLKWDGPILEPLDGLPYIGRYSVKKPNQYVAMGFSGNGMTYAMISARICTDLILGKENDWIELYDPTRHHTLKSLWQKGIDYTGEMFGGAGKNMFRKI